MDKTQSDRERLTAHEQWAQHAQAQYAREVGSAIRELRGHLDFLAGWCGQLVRHIDGLQAHGLIDRLCQQADASRVMFYIVTRLLGDVRQARGRLQGADDLTLAVLLFPPESSPPPGGAPAAQADPPPASAPPEPSANGHPVILRRHGTD